MIDTHVLKKKRTLFEKNYCISRYRTCKSCHWYPQCGKSSLLKLMTLHLKENGVSEEQILEMNFESYAFKDMNSDDFYKYVKARIIEEKENVSLF